MNISQLKIGLLVFLFSTLGSSYGNANSTTVKLYCPAADTLTYKDGQYTGKIESHEVSAGQESQFITSTSTGPELEKGEVSFRNTRVFMRGESIEVDCGYNVVISQASKENPLELTFQINLKDRKLANSCRAVGCTGSSSLTNLCYIFCQSK
ncbi:MAG: hypothetical protein BGO67_09580 [Alphaproteobacteria bacterium 41-28]|nr:MAG: hypothetical protein BGO67_09580 [Alphaproteobacteria bacterium 41-28]